MNRDTCLITGATSGIGKAAALAFSKKDCRVILMGRNKEKTARAGDEIKRKSRNKDVSFYVCDLADRLKGKGIAVNAVDPGGVATNFARNNGLVPWLKHRLYYLKKRQLLTPASSVELSGIDLP